MVKFRWHRGSLDDSMATVVEFDGSIHGLIDILKADALPWFPPLELDQVKVIHYGYDPRIEWHTHMVTVMGGAIGFTDGPVY